MSSPNQCVPPRQQSETTWVPRLRLKRSALMQMWRYAVITYLRDAVKAGVLSSDMRRAELSDFLATQYERWWSLAFVLLAAYEVGFVDGLLTGYPS